MRSHPQGHLEHVSGWLDEVTHTVTAPQLIELCQRALVALWQGSKMMLGEVTLTAIVDRVLFMASELHPFVSITKTEGPVVSFEIRQSGDIQNFHRLREVVQFVLVEYLTVLGHLTDEIVTPALHTALTNVRCEPLDGVGEPDAEEEDAR